MEGLRTSPDKFDIGIMNEKVNFTFTGGTDKSDGDFNFGHKSDSVLSPQYK